MPPVPALLAQLSPAAARWSDRLNQVQELLAPVAGRWAKATVVPGVTGLQLALAGAILVATAVVVLAGRALARREAAKAAHKPKTSPVSWLRLVLRDARQPLLLAVAIWGLHGAMSLLLFRIPAHSGTVLGALGWAEATGLILALFWFLFRLIDVLELELNRLAAASARKWDEVLFAVLVRALRLIVPLLCVLVVAPTLDLPEAGHAAIQTGASLALMAFTGLAFWQLADTAEKAVVTQYRVDVKDNLATRKVQTQVRILKRLAVTVIAVVTLACMLTVFAPVRALGRSILASAGIAGIVLGIAAQRSLGSMLAGVQIAFSQPIRLDDVVIVEGEWGRIEEITLTYVVVAIWDLRRLVLPITYFVEKPFQNWTRSSSTLLGTVFLYLDYTAPIDALRAELDRILERSPRWDRQVKGLQVTDAKDRTIEVRILASSADSSLSWDLRCEIREKLIDFLQRNHPHALPRERAEIGRPAPQPGASPPTAETARK